MQPIHHLLLSCLFKGAARVEARNSESGFLRFDLLVSTNLAV